MRAKLLLAGAAAALLVGMVPSPAHAEDANITATIAAGAGAGRTLSVNPTIALAALGTTQLRAQYVATVTEANVVGDNTGYSVTAKVTNLVKTGDATKTINASAFNLGAPTMVTTPLTGTDSTANAGGQFTGTTVSQDLILWENSGQVDTANYTGAHVGTGNLTLTVPDGQTSTGGYTGTFTVTLLL